MIWFAAIAVLIAAVTVWYMARPLARPAMPDSGEQRDQLQQLRERLLVQLNELDIEEGDRNIDTDVVSDERRRLEAELARTLHELETLEGGNNKKKKKKAKSGSRRGWAIGLAVMSLLISVKEAEFTFIKEKTNATAGNLSVQVQKLKEAGYIEVVKELLAQGADLTKHTNGQEPWYPNMLALDIAYAKLKDEVTEDQKNKYKLIVELLVLKSKEIEEVF